MENEIFKMAVQQGIWAMLFIFILIYVLKEQKERDEKAGEREANYQGIIAKLTDRLKAMDDIGEDVKEIKNKIFK
ncbi:BhlA/UviB family holin-like peptide [Clostridium sp. Mt-5]|uniref:BhlA/UviB family holin-like peptide n=1 Tax=Clostridium moutaii TaxID=3240932 RepID=A0ABV4BTE1_9CLOT